ncbi:hypothetical protein GGR51DRAFT_530051 [Nemania sp. FL0031]|nr:hypothetical protein GGR51DRAFT_530051 [Nemania sp. FL0031]
MFAPSFHVCPDFHIEPPPYGHLNLGSILSGLDAGSVRAPLNRRSVIPVMDTYKYPKSGPYRKDGWSLSLSQLQSIEGGIWARIFTSKGAGAGLEFHQAPSGEDILTVEHTFVQYFFPTEEYMKRSLEIDGVDCFVSVSRKKLPLYMVTGLMWAVGANWSHVSRKERTFKGEAGYGGEDSLSTTFGRSKPLLLGIRVRKIWWDKSRKTKKNDDVVGRTCRSNQIRSEQLNDGLIWQDDFTVDENAEPSVLDKVIVDESKLMSEDPIVWVLD